MQRINVQHRFLKFFANELLQTTAKKFITVIIFFLCAIHVEAQQQDAAKKLLNDIEAGIKAVKKDSSIPDDCKKNINRFQETIDKENDGWTNKNIANYTKACKQFNASADKKYKDKCRNKQVTNIITLISKLTTELIKSSSIDSLKNKTNTTKIADTTTKNNIRVIVTINVTDSNSNSNIKSSLNIDSLNNTIKVFELKPGVFEATLTENVEYDFKATAGDYNPYDSNFFINRAQKNVVIKLSKTVSSSRQSSSSGFNNQFVFLIGLLIALIILIVLVAIFYLNTRKNFSILSSSINNMNLLLINQEKKPDDTTAVSKIPAAVNENITSALPVIEETINNKNEQGAGFLCEIMMTSGPRKDDDEDVDLGEDICGFVSGSNEILLWLLDGTSNRNHWASPVLNREYFSSRLLAQSIGGEIRKSFANKTEISLENIFKNSVNSVITRWLNEFNNLDIEDKKDFKHKIKEKKIFDCSTTVLIIRLLNNGELNAFRAGDSKAFLFGDDAEKKVFINTPLAKKDDEDRLFFQLRIDENDKFHLAYNEKLKYDIINEKDVTAIVSFSDGIGMNTEQKLREEFKNNPGHVKNNIMFDKQGTLDDKTICFIELKK